MVIDVSAPWVTLCIEESGTFSEAGTRLSHSGSGSAVMSNRAVECSFLPRRVEKSFRSPGTRFDLVADSRGSPEGGSTHGSSPRTDSIYGCVSVEGEASGKLFGIRRRTPHNELVSGCFSYITDVSSGSVGFTFRIDDF